jgi:hypothetical protein
MSAMASTLAAAAVRAGPAARPGSRSNKTTAAASGMVRVRAQRSALAGQPVVSSARCVLRRLPPIHAHARNPPE